MNTKLKILFEQYEFSRRDIHDFMQVYNLLPDYKKVKAIENFESIAASIGWLREDMLLEQEILFGQTLKNIEEKLQNTKQARISQDTKWDIAMLKNMIS